MIGPTHQTVVAVFLSTLFSASIAGRLDFFTPRAELREMEVVTERRLLLELENMQLNGNRNPLPCLALDIDETLAWTGNLPTRFQNSASLNF